MFARRLLAVYLALTPLACPVRAAETMPPIGAVDALQVLADLTLIDGACRDESVNFGIGFRFAVEKGLPELAVLPGGSRRTEFESVLRARRASFDHDELCGEIAENYAEALPGSVSIRPRAGLR